MTEYRNPFDKPAFFEQALFLYIKYLRYLEDDYALNNSNIYDYFFNLIQRTSPFFFVITEGDLVSGFVYLDNLIGDGKRLHSAELTTCFDKKIKALVYPDNSRVKTLLKNSGFVKEAVLKNETLRNNKLQDVEVYSVFSQFYNR